MPVIIRVRVLPRFRFSSWSMRDDKQSRIINGNRGAMYLDAGLASHLADHN